MSELLGGTRAATGNLRDRHTWRAWLARGLCLGLLGVGLVAILGRCAMVYLWVMNTDAGLPGWVSRHMDDRALAG